MSLFDGENGVTIGNYGLNEYEILPDTNTIAITLLRSVGEMGDWGISLLLKPNASANTAYLIVLKASLSKHNLPAIGGHKKAKFLS